MGRQPADPRLVRPRLLSVGPQPSGTVNAGGASETAYLHHVNLGTVCHLKGGGRAGEHGANSKSPAGSCSWCLHGHLSE
eukprot:scaffold4732_cov344-Prasinococcus_capsulatus_cf.AAC.2